MKKFIYCILFGALILPITDSILTIINQITKYICLILEAKYYQKQSELYPEEDSPINPIGFQAPSSKCKDEGEY